MYFQRLSHEAKIAFKIYFEFLIDVIRLELGKGRYIHIWNNIVSIFSICAGFSDCMFDMLVHNTQNATNNA